MSIVAKWSPISATAELLSAFSGSLIWIRQAVTSRCVCSIKIVDKNLHISPVFSLCVQYSLLVIHICVLLCSQLDSYENIIWDKPYSHAGAYVVGAWLGYLLYSQQGQVYMSRVSYLVIYLLQFATEFIIIQEYLLVC